MQRAARGLGGTDRGLQGGIEGERAVRDCVSDAHEVLLDDAARADVQVSHLRVAHLALGQTDVPSRGRELGVREAREQRIEDRGVRELDGIAGTRRRDPESVQDDERDRSRHAAARTIPAKVCGSRLAPPTSAPSISAWPISSAAFSGLTEPP